MGGAARALQKARPRSRNGVPDFQREEERLWAASNCEMILTHIRLRLTFPLADANLTLRTPPRREGKTKNRPRFLWSLQAISGPDISCGQACGTLR
jgi:hypothetical protein